MPSSRSISNLAVQPENRALIEHWRTVLKNEARELGDLSMLAGNELVQTPFDRSKLAVLPISGMGWRWY